MLIKFGAVLLEDKRRTLLDSIRNSVSLRDQLSYQDPRQWYSVYVLADLDYGVIGATHSLAYSYTILLTQGVIPSN